MPGGAAGSSGQDASSPSPGGDIPAGEGATPPTATAGAQQPGPQQGALAQFMGLMGFALHFMDMAVRLGPTSEERDFAMHHLNALSKRFRKMSPPGNPSPAQLPLAPPQGGALPAGPASNPTGQPATPNLPRGPMPSPVAGGNLPG